MQEHRTPNSTAVAVSAAAQQAFEAFEMKTREDGSQFFALVEDAPSWVHNMVVEAHDGELPDDWRFAAVNSATVAIVDALRYGTDLEGQAHEWADGMVAAYTSELLEWLNTNHSRLGYVDGAAVDGLAGEELTLMGRIRVGQYVALERLFSVVQCAVEDRAEQAIEKLEAMRAELES